MRKDPFEFAKPSIVWVCILIGIPAFIFRARQVQEETKQNRAHMQCFANLQQIDLTAQAWALENKKALTDTYSLSDTTILAYMKGSMLPVCPFGGTYSPGTNHGDVPKCSVPGHRLLYPTPMGGYVR